MAKSKTKQKARRKLAERKADTCWTVHTERFKGQPRIEEQIQVAIIAAKKRKELCPHILMSGPPGLGKTFLADLIAKDMGQKLISRVATAIRKPVDLCQLMIPCAHTAGMVLFIDEVEQLPRACTELLHTALEGQILSGPDGVIPLQPFTLLAATNYLGELPAPFRDRFGLHLDFEPYAPEALYTILYDRVQEERIPSTRQAMEHIAERSRGTPRIAIRLLHSARDMAIARNEYEGMLSRDCALATFDMLGIDTKGLNPMDRAILQVLSESDKAVGLSTLALCVGEDKSTIETAEGYLLRLGFIHRTARGRTITEKGTAHISQF